MQRSIPCDSISPHLVPAVPVSLPLVGSWAIDLLLLLYLCIFLIESGAAGWEPRGKWAPGGLDIKVPWGRTASPQGWPVPSARGAFSVLSGPLGTGRAAL